MMPNVEFILAGWDTSAYEIRFPHLNAGKVPLRLLADLYSNCDVALVVSSTNLSLLPLELMACGCVVVSNRGPNTEWLLNESNAVLADATPIALSDALMRVLKDAKWRRTLSENGKVFAEATDWMSEAEKVASALEGLLSRTKHRSVA
jgi:glycosyltransferase involved in cell wall biosynthesis